MCIALQFGHVAFCAVSELFKSESLTQVYGILHQLLDQNVINMDSLSK